MGNKQWFDWLINLCSCMFCALQWTKKLITIKIAVVFTLLILSHIIWSEYCIRGTCRVLQQYSVFKSDLMRSYCMGHVLALRFIEMIVSSHN